MTRSMHDISQEEKQDLYKAVVKEALNGMDYQGLAARYNIKPYVISNIAGVLRKKGLDLPKKTASSVLTPEFLRELKMLIK